MVEYCCHDGNKRLIIPVFFDVDPRDVRRQTGPFDAAFQKHQKDNSRDVEGWKQALEYVGGISGFHLKNGNQRALMNSITAEIQQFLSFKKLLHEKEYLVGLELRAGNMMKRLNFEAKDVLIIAIHGIGGVGKTTLAKAIYNRSHRFFEACSFIENVREVSKLPKGLVQLQQQLIQDICKGKSKEEINSPREGTQTIKDMVGSIKSVLLVLDDVDDRKVLEAVAGNRNWFYPGSRIIITTRQEEILESVELREEDVYQLEELNEEESLQLFNYHAFIGDEAQEKYLTLSQEIISISNGLPLVIETFGSLFKTAKSIEEWKELLKDMRLHQHSKVHEKLRICYDSLDECEKLVFLDIACLLVGKNADDTIYMWEAHNNLSPHAVIRSLQNRSLLKIDKGKFEMHDQIRDMGREIVLTEDRKENSTLPLKRRRLWREEDVVEAANSTTLSKENETQGVLNEIEGILLTLREGHETELSTEAFGLMAKLRILLTNLSITNIGCDFKHFPASLKWLEWKGCPLETLPLEIKFKNIVVLNLSRSFISQLWSSETTAGSSSRSSEKMFPGLKVLDLSGCDCLNATPNFSVAPNLKKLILDYCSNLNEVEDSIGFLKELVSLSMKGCVSLKKLPRKIYELSSLEFFNLDGCSKLVTFPEISPENSTNGLSNLQQLILRGCERLEFVPQLRQFRSLKSVHLDGCQSLDHTRDRLFEEDVADREWDELSMSEGGTQLSWKGEFSFVLPAGSINHPLLMLECHSHNNPVDSPSMKLYVRYEDIANGDWVETMHVARCDDSICNDDMYGYTVQLPWDDMVNEAPRSTSIKMKVRGRSNHVLEKVVVKLQKGSMLSGESMMPVIKVSRRGTSGPELSIFINGHEKCEPDVIVYQRDLDGRIDELRKLDVQSREQKRLFGWTVEELIILPLILSDIKVFWYEQWHGTRLRQQEREKVFDKLKVLDLSHCKFLVKTPDFSRTPHLEKLILDHCKCLVEIDDSIGQLKYLVLLSLIGCTKLRILPLAILQLNSLSVLNLSNCSEFFYVKPEVSMIDVSSNVLHELILDNCTSLYNLPDCVGRLENLLRLSLRGCDNLTQLPVSIGNWVAFEDLILYGHPKLRRLPNDIGELKRLRRLHLGHCRSLRELPDSVGSLETLEELILNDCISLRRLPDSMGNLQRLTTLRARNCSELKSMPELLNLIALKELNVEGCESLVSIGGLQNLISLKILNMLRCSKLDHNLLRLQLEEAVFHDLEEFAISSVDNIDSIISFPIPRWGRTSSQPLLVERILIERIPVKSKVHRKISFGIKVAGEDTVLHVGVPCYGFGDCSASFEKDDEVNKHLIRMLAANSHDATRVGMLHLSLRGWELHQTRANVWFRRSPSPET